MSAGHTVSGSPTPRRAEVRVYDGEQQLAEAAARLVVDEARRAVARSGRFSMALAGGSTPRATYTLLARPPFSTDVPWGLSHIFWGDERCVPAGDPRSNEQMVRETLLQHVAVPPGQVHPVRCGSEAEAGEAATRYEDLLRTAAVGGPLGLDLVLLGLGDDGHTASLFPGSVALSEHERWVVESTGAGIRRVTLTAAFINLAGLVVFLVSGATKALAVKQALESADESAASLPARLIQPAHGRVLWLLDQEAAALLTAAPRNGGLA